MKAYRILIGILILFVLMIMDPWDDILGQHLQGSGGKGFLSGLTEEQREAVQGKVKEMRNQGATREEIGTAVDEMLKGYGVELPEKLEGLNKPMGFGPPGGFLDKLSEEQREAVLGKIKEMRSQNASPEEIRAAVGKLFEGYGIKLPEHQGEGSRGDFRGLLSGLTEEQRGTVQEKMKEMRNQGATREEIGTAVREMLKGYGIQLPENPGIGGRGGFKPFLSKLSDEQRETVLGKIKEMRSQGASREEIRATVSEMLKGYGILLPENTENSTSKDTPVESQIKTGNYPNPFNPQTQIAYSLTEDCYVKLTIYNIQGQKVKQLLDEYQSAGTKEVVWDGCDENGERVASGIYFYRIEAGPNFATKRMVLLK
jgi:hypothetical protein